MRWAAIWGAAPLVAVELAGNGHLESLGLLPLLAALPRHLAPGGVLVLEARRERATDDEAQTLVLSGQCRAEDVTSSNTVLSSQLADLILRTENTGQIKDSSTIGWIPRVLEAIFNF